MHSAMSAWTNLKFKVKIPAAIVGFALVLGIGIGVASYLTAANEIRQLTEKKLEAAANDRKGQLSNYLTSIEQDLRTVATNPTTLSALSELGAQYRAIPGDAVQTLHADYITNNPNPTGQKHKLDSGLSGSAYDAAHGRFHPWFRQFLEERGYYDIFLFDTNGNLVYTVFKELDFATNFNVGAGQWAETDIGKAYRASMAAQKGQISFYDFKPYAPSANVPAGFISIPIFSGETRVGVLAFQMPIERINTIMSDVSGVGETGEAFIVGDNGLLRNNSKFTEDDDILKTKFETKTSASALTGKASAGFSDQYRGEKMQEFAAPFSFNGTNWAIVAVQTVKEANQPLASMRNSMLMVASLLLALTALCGMWLAQTMTKPMTKVIDAMNLLANGKLDLELDDSGRGDEIGDLNRALAVFKSNAMDRARLETTADQERRRELGRQAHIGDLISEFRNVISAALNAVGNETTAMRTSASVLTQVASSASLEADAAREASAGASSNVQAVAAAAEELSASIREIASQAHQASDVVGRATAITRQTDADVSSLAEAAQKIGTVVGMIRDIAEQTNLLALNATVEAARAGEAGRGFAVVASEVKALSSQTARATEDIGRQIALVQSSTQQAVDSIRKITNTIADVDTFTSAIAAAVEEQDAATQEIAKSIGLAFDGSNAVARNVDTVALSIGETSQQADMVMSVSDSLSRVADELSNGVDRFLSDVSADYTETEKRRA